MTNKINHPVFAFLIVLLAIAFFCGCIALESDTSTTGNNDGSPQSVQPASPSRSTASFADPIAPGESPQPVRDLGEKNGEMTTENLRVTFRSHTPIFQTSISPRFNSQGIRVDVKRGPLLVNYQTIPLQNDPRISFLVITIRDMDTGTIVAQDGYGNPFTSSPEKQIIVYGDGPYHINIYGNQMDVNVGVYTGDSP